MEKEWKDVTNYFSEKQRHYNGKYLELDLVIDNIAEIQLYRVINTSEFPGKYEIFVNLGDRYGSLYKDDPYETFEAIKKELYDESFKENKFSHEFYSKLSKKYGISFPTDAFFSL